MNVPTSNSAINCSFFVHLAVTILAWLGPFLISWQLMITAFVLVQLQFMFFGRCLLNEQHELKEENDFTFYAYLFEKMGFKTNRKLVKKIVRGGLYWALAAMTFWWQVVLGNEEIWF